MVTTFLVLCSWFLCLVLGVKFRNNLESENLESGKGRGGNCKGARELLGYWACLQSRQVIAIGSEFLVLGF
jgi:hypothetical protein